ncbi:MAG: cytochrome c family protein [Candidatus Omnitrophota bacterium]
MKGKIILIFSSMCLMMLFASSGEFVCAQENTDQASQGAYLGAEKCSTCHPAEFQDFQKRKFNKSWKILKMQGEEKNTECLKCHVTGYGKGGFESEEKTPNLLGKQCEACHGPGGKHVGNPSDAGARQQLKVSGKKNVCVECHACMSTHRTLNF